MKLLIICLALTASIFTASALIMDRHEQLDKELKCGANLHLKEGSDSDFMRQNQRFLGTEFGMSVKDTCECLALRGAKLLDADGYLEAPNAKLLELEISFIPFYPSWGKRDTYYMPAILLFESEAEASFKFKDDRLESIGVHFSPLFKSKSQFLVDTLDRELRTKYVFENKEESAELPGAYRVIYRKNEAIITLWVNLIDAKEPVVSVHIIDNLAKTTREEKQRQMDSVAF